MNFLLSLIVVIFVVGMSIFIGYRVWLSQTRCYPIPSAKPLIICGNCKQDIYEDAQEYCWYCHGPICYACWDDIGHCGHLEAEAINDYAKGIEKDLG